MKQRVLYAALLLFILLFTQCEKDTEPEHTIEIKAATPGFKTAVVNAKQIGKITQSLQAETGLQFFNKDTVSGIVFDTEHIMEVIDTLNNASYSFRFAYPDTPEHIFYNLVVSADSTGTLQTPYVVKYECDPAHFQDFKDNAYQFQFFRGAVALHLFSHYFGDGTIFNKTDPECVQHDQYGDPIPCLQTHVGSSGTGGGDPGTGFPTGNTNSGTGNSGGGGTGGYNITLSCSCVGHTENDIEAGICTCPNFILTINGNAGNANKGLKSTDCPPCMLPGGSSGVNLLDVFDDQIFVDEDFKNQECLYGVYETMGKASTFQNYLKNFDSDFSVGHLRFGYDEDFSTNRPIEYHNSLAITDPPENSLVKIDFNGDVNLESSIHNKPKLIIALAFIHEIIHAEIFRKMLSAAQTGSLDSDKMTTQQQITYVNNLRNNFPGLYDYYVIRWREDSGHQMMAQHYRNIIASAIAEYDNNQNSQAIYEALAWIGLKNTIAWNNLTSEEQENINNTISNVQQTATDKCN